MPRSTLPVITTKMRTIEVILTKTTEEAIWTHLEKQIVGLESTIEMFSRDLNALTDKYFHLNPFDKYSVQDWRDGRPKQKYKLNRLLWLEENGEEYMKEYFNMLDIMNDIRICSRAFPEWAERLHDIMEVVDFAKFDTDELVAYESIKYYEAKKRYEESDAEYITERKLANDHRDIHISREKYLMDDYSRNILCGGVEPAYWTTCKWCIQHEQRLKDIKEAEAEEERRIQEDNKRYEAEQQQKRKAERQHRESYRCELCDLKWSNIDAYERHMESKEHRVKQNHADWFCKACNIQSRSNNEHEFHMKSAKHQKNVNGGESKIITYKCECCEYETARKDLYSRHLLSNKHMELSKK